MAVFGNNIIGRNSRAKMLKQKHFFCLILGIISEENMAHICSWFDHKGVIPQDRRRVKVKSFAFMKMP